MIYPYLKYMFHIANIMVNFILTMIFIMVNFILAMIFSGMGFIMVNLIYQSFMLKLIMINRGRRQRHMG